MKQYHELLKTILEKGQAHNDRIGVGTISIFGHQSRYDLRHGFPIVTTKRTPFRFVAEELFWFLSGDTNEKNLQTRGVDIWAEWATVEHTEKFGREQGDLGTISLIREIETNPNSRRLIVSGWNPKQLAQVDLPPCHTLFQFKIENEKILHCQLYQRGADAFLFRN